MKSATIIAAAAVALCSSDVNAYSFGGQQLQNGARNAGRTMSMEYIPSGMSKEQWAKVKAAEKNANKGKDLGKSGGVNLFPVDPRGKKESELPYMQRAGGSADGADLKGGAKKKAPTFFTFGGKKKAPEPEPEPEPKKKNWWTL